MGAILMFILIDIICVASLVYLFIEKRNEKKKMQAQHSSNVLNPLACGHRTASQAHHQRWHRNIDNGFNSHRATEFFKFSVSSENLKIHSPWLCASVFKQQKYLSLCKRHMSHEIFLVFPFQPLKAVILCLFQPFNFEVQPSIYLRYTFAVPSLFALEGALVLTSDIPLAIIITCVPYYIN